MKDTNLHSLKKKKKSYNLIPEQLAMISFALDGFDAGDRYCQNECEEDFHK